MYKFKFFILAFISNIAYSQSIQVDLSIEWREVKHLAPIAEDSTKIPFLKITYTNLSDTAFYFQKIGNPSYTGYIDFPTSFVCRCRDDCPNKYEMVIKDQNQWHSDSFIVNIEYQTFHVKMDTDIVKDTVIEDVHLINADLNNIYNFLQRIAYRDMNYEFTELYWHESDLGKQYVRFFEKNFANIKDVDKYNLKGKLFAEKMKLSWKKRRSFFGKYSEHIEMIQKYFYNMIFLQPYAQYEEEYNLVGFWYVGGTYTFKVSTEVLQNQSFFPISYNKKIRFPEKLNNCKLYQGFFIANETILEIKK